MKQMSIGEQITYSTVLITCKYGHRKIAIGTGFIMGLCENKEQRTYIPVLITNDHLITDSKSIEFKLCKADAAGNPIDTEQITCSCSPKDWIHHPDTNVDLIILPLEDIIEELKCKGENIFFIPLSTKMIPTAEELIEMSIIEDVVMFGHPKGKYDDKNYKPIIRKGITSSHPSKYYRREREFLIDIACYPGSSGSPVFLYNHDVFSTKIEIEREKRAILLGVLSKGEEYYPEVVGRFHILSRLLDSLIRIPLNMGIAIKSERILEFEKN